MDPISLDSNLLSHAKPHVLEALERSCQIMSDLVTMSDTQSEVFGLCKYVFSSFAVLLSV